MFKIYLKVHCFKHAKLPTIHAEERPPLILRSYNFSFSGVKIVFLFQNDSSINYFSLIALFANMGNVQICQCLILLESLLIYEI